MSNFTVIPQGVRGSIPTPCEGNRKYGCNTSCFKLQIDGYTLFLDAGTGILNAGSVNGDADVVLSHMHIDHILGLTMWNTNSELKSKIRIFSKKRFETNTQEQLNMLMREPLWPVKLKDMHSQLEFCDLNDYEPFEISAGVIIELFPTNHPCEGCGILVKYDNKRLCYLVDYEHGSIHDEYIEKITKCCDMLIYDSHFSDEDYKIGWGHSTWQKGIELAKRCGAKKTLLTHHNPEYSDKKLDRISEQLSCFNPVIQLAREKEVHCI